MTDNTSSDPNHSAQQRVISPVALGLFYAVLSAVFYTFMSICQRKLSEDCDPVLVNSVQASVSTVIFGIYLIFRSARGRSAWPPLGVALGLMMLGAITQLGGTSYQWSLGIVGLTIGIPLQTGVMLSTSAIMGLLLLGERISWKAATAIVLITVAILLLASGAESANEALQSDDAAAVEVVATEAGAGDPSEEYKETPKSSGTFWILLGVAAACFSGVAFAILTVGMRKTASEDTSPEAIVFFINCMGILFLGPWVLWRLGLDGICATSPENFAVMLATGACNLVAFLLIAKALQLATVVRVNVINNAVSTSLIVLAGIVIFAEPYNSELIFGILLALVGIVLISYNAAEDEEPQTTVAVETRE